MSLPSPSSCPARAVFLGLMSGTSMDGIDGVAAEIDARGKVRVLAHRHGPFESALRAELLALNQSGPDELRRAALAGNGVARAYASLVQQLRADLGEGARVIAVGAHGQTVRHQPGVADGVGFTSQLNNPALLAELGGLDVVADFRTRDLAAGGQGAPLAPGFHESAFAADEAPVAVLNLGGIANLSLLEAGRPPLGFDCGPANALLDHWIERHQGQAFDDDGQWSAGGQLLPDLLASLMTEPYLAATVPKSTGRDLFNPDWLAHQAGPRLQCWAARDVQATLAQYTVACVALHLGRWAPAAMRRLIVCGGGALNSDLMRRLATALPGWQVDRSDVHGLPPLQVEAAAFAWLAWRFMMGLPGNLPSVTGARGPRRLGAWYPAH